MGWAAQWWNTLLQGDQLIVLLVVLSHLQVSMLQELQGLSRCPLELRYPNIVSTPNMLYIKPSICLKMLFL